MGCSKSQFVRGLWPWPLVACLFVTLSSAASAEAPLDFNRDIRPILSENCFYCHGQDGNKREADLRLDVREAAIEAGAIVPGEPGASTVLERIHSTDPDVLMPPPDSNRRLSEAQKQLLDRWIKEGAEYKQHWSFTAPERPTPPDVRQDDWVRNDIDRLDRKSTRLNSSHSSVSRMPSSA